MKEGLTSCGKEYRWLSSLSISVSEVRQREEMVGNNDLIAFMTALLNSTESSNTVNMFDDI